MLFNKKHGELHFSQRNNWLRAGVLGANDGLISTASLLFGLAISQPDRHIMIVTAIAALTAGAIAMAAGEYVSVSSQADTEQADLIKEAYEIEHHPEEELKELQAIYQARGLSEELAKEVARALTKHNALLAHARDEIGIMEITQAKPLEAAFASAFAFCLGALLPVLIILFCPQSILFTTLGISTLCGLSGLGYLSAKLGGAPVIPAIRRIVIWGILSLLLTSLIGYFFGVV